MEWTADMIGRLRGLWDDGHSTAEISRRMGVTKNSIIGKSHRLKLPARPTPIQERGSGRRPRSYRRPPVPKLAQLQGMAEPLALPSAEPFVWRQRVPVATQAVRRQQPMPVLVGRVTACAYPHGEPRTSSFHFCDAQTLPGSPYCPEHHQICHARQYEDVA